MKPKTKKTLTILLGCILFGGITAAAVPVMQYMMQPSFQQSLQQWVQQAGIWGVGLLLGIQMLQILVAFIPGEPVEVVAGAMYGTLGGLTICLVGILLASAGIFVTVRRLGRERLSHTKLYPKLMEYQFLKNEDKLSAMVFLLYLIPGTPKDILVYVCALTKLPLRRFLVISTLARIPSVVTSTMAGASFASGNHLVTLLIFAVTGLAGLLGIVYHNKRFGKKQNRED